eukprot:237226_1
MGNAVNSCINSNDYPDGRSSQDAPESNYSGRHKYTRPVDRSEHSRPAHSNNAAARPHHHRAAHGRAREDDDQYFKLLFLGAGESGECSLHAHEIFRLKKTAFLITVAVTKYKKKNKSIK